MLKSSKRARAALSVAVAAVLLAGACGGDSASDDTAIQEAVPMKVWVRMEGDLRVRIEGRTVPTRVVRLEGAGEAVPPTFGVQPADLIQEGDVRVQPGVSVIPYRGNGLYTIEPGVPRDALEGAGDSGAPTHRSSVRVEWWKVDGEPFEYVRRAKPCTVDVEDNGMKGRLRCPDLTHEAPGGPHFSLDFRWEKA